MYKLFLTLRYLRKRRIAVFAVVSVWLCVAMEVIVISVMGGFLDTLKERSRGLLSDIVIDNGTLVGFPLYEEFLTYLRETSPELIDTGTAVVYNYGIFRVEGASWTKPVQVVGIDLKGYEAVNDFGNSLFYDRYYPGTTTLAPQYQPYMGWDEQDRLSLPPDHAKAYNLYRDEHPDDPVLESLSESPEALRQGPGVFERIDGKPGYYGGENDLAPGVIVGCDVINERLPSGDYRRRWERGHRMILSLLPLTRKGNLSAEGAVRAVVRLADDSRTRVYEIDDKCVYVEFGQLQRWLAMDEAELEDGGVSRPRTSQVLISLKPGTDLVQGRKAIETEWERFLAQFASPLSDEEWELLSYVQVETWEERQRPFINAVEKEKILVTLLFGVVSLVAVVLIGCIFWMIVHQKTRDIGIVKSVGASSVGVATVFIGFGIAVGVVGTIGGALSGAVFVHYINDIQDLLVQLDPNLRVWSPDIYTFDRIPNVVKWNEVSIIGVVAVFASVVGALVPAVIASRIWPVEALRYE
jgi:lipoprotein-releasing system permease protein